MAVTAGLRVVQALQRGRRAAENDLGLDVLRADDRQIARRIAKAILLLVRRIVLLVDHDQAELGAWHEARRTRADDPGSRPLAARPPPLFAHNGTAAWRDKGG